MKEKVKAIILNTMEELNEQLEDTKKLEISDENVIFGKSGKLDSLDFVNFMVMIEDNIFAELDRSITIVSEKAFSKKYNPFANVERLTDFIVELLESE